MVQLDKLQNENPKFYLDKIIGMPCWAIVAGEGSGSRILMSFGKKFPRDHPVYNDHLIYEARYFNPELSLFIQDAEWQVLNSYQNDLLICNCYSSNDNEGEMVNGLNQLISKCVVSTMLDFNGKDFEINFEGGLKLCVICLKEVKVGYIDYDFNLRN